jgi:HK97 family phage prohead protease
MAFTEALHPRDAGKFAVAPGPAKAAAAKKTAAPRKRAAAPAHPHGSLAFDGKTGPGYNTPGGDKRVHSLQQALNRLGLTDASGKKLVDDGKLGPKTTAAIKKAQRALGVKADGVVTPALLKQLTAAKSLKSAAAKKTAAPAKKAGGAKTAPRTAPPKKIVPVTAKRSDDVMPRPTFHRSFALDSIEIRRSGDGRTVEAYAAVFDQPTEVKDQHGHYLETIDRSAFKRQLNSGSRLPLVLYNHGLTLDGAVDSLAQVPIGTALEVRADDHGLFTVTRYNKSALADSVLASIENGDIKAQSFRGAIFGSEPRGRVPRIARGGSLPTVRRTSLGLSDYGPTPVPYYQGALITAVRSMTDIAAELAELDDDARAELVRALQATPFAGQADSATSTHVEPGTEDLPADAAHSGRDMEEVRRKIHRARVLERI